MTSSQDARHVVLRVKELMIAMEKTNYGREQFVEHCTNISRQFMVMRRGSYTVPLSNFDVQLLQKMINEATAPGGNNKGAVAASAGSPSAVAHQRQGSPSQYSSRSPSVTMNGTELPQTMVLPPIKVAVATTVKQILDPYFRAKLLTRDAYSQFVQSVTKEFFAKFPLDKTKNPQLRDSDSQWLSSTIQARLLNDHGIDPTAAAAAQQNSTSAPRQSQNDSAHRSSPPSRAQTSDNGVVAEQTATSPGGAFDAQLGKLKDVINKEFTEDENAYAHHSSAEQGHSPLNTEKAREQIELAKRRKQLVFELQELDSEARRIEELRKEKLELLASLV